MALTFPRWIGAAVVGCALLLVATLQTNRRQAYDGFQRTRRELLDHQRGIARERLNLAAEHLHVIALRDSLAARKGGTSIAAGRLFIDPVFTPEYRQFFTALATRRSGDSAAVGTTPRASALPIDFAFVFDTGGLAVSAFTPMVGRAALESRRSFPGYWSIDYVLPAAASMDRCVVVVRYDARLAGTHQGRATLAARSNLAGPCAYYSAFGMPGFALDAWLRARGWSLGERTAWTRPASTMAYEQRWPSSASRFDMFEGWQARRALKPSWVRCQAGDLATCEQAILAPSPSGPAAWSEGIVATHLTYSNPFEKYVLSEMVRTLGPDRFEKFWRSPASPGIAFEAAAGMSLGQWGNDLMRRSYGDQHLGPGVDAAGLGFGTLLFVLGIALAVRVAAKRAVG